MTDHSPIDRLLHRLILSNPPIGELIFDLEQSLRKSADAPTPPGLHILGLARSGTTALVRALYETGDFASLTYWDMPFVMAPNLWARISGRFRRESNLRERAHGDGILIDQDSLEALDEVFWRVKTSKDYIRGQALLYHSPGQNVISDYAQLMLGVCTRYNKARYLSKNNNNVLRLESLARANGSS